MQEKNHHESEERKQELEVLQQKLGYRWLDVNHLQRSLTHSSYGNSHGIPHSERDEFLGDSVLDLVTAEWLMAQHPDRREGFMSQQRALLVQQDALCRHSKALGIDRALLVGAKSEYLRSVESVLADAFEAVVGALYRDSGSLDAVRRSLLNCGFFL